jgi:hypothetical protein
VGGWARGRTDAPQQLRWSLTVTHTHNQNRTTNTFNGAFSIHPAAEHSILAYFYHAARYVPKSLHVTVYFCEPAPHVVEQGPSATLVQAYAWANWILNGLPLNRAMEPPAAGTKGGGGGGGRWGGGIQ